MRIGIITLNGYFNYGNRLQNYALHYALKKLNDRIKVDTIWYGQNNSLLDNDFNTAKFVRRYLFNRHGFRNYINKRKYLQEGIREYNIKKFSEKFIDTVFVDSVDSVKNDYDFFISGSDQIWNPHWVEGYAEFLAFADPGKRISYAASFGVNEVMPEKESLFKSYLEGMDYISVRESAGADIVKKLTGREAQVLIDPTLLLSRDEWRAISSRPNWYKGEKYLLVFFLNGLSEATRHKIESIAAAENMKIIDLLDENQFELYTTSPEEFLFTVEHASLIFTDSFHGTVFSIIMGVPFVNFGRKDMDMNSRIDTLLSLVGLECRRAVEDGDMPKNLFATDYSEAWKRIEKEREKSLKFLCQALNLAGDGND